MHVYVAANGTCKQDKFFQTNNDIKFWVFLFGCLQQSAYLYIEANCTLKVQFNFSIFLQNIQIFQYYTLSVYRHEMYALLLLLCYYIWLDLVVGYPYLTSSIILVWKIYIANFVSICFIDNFVGSLCGMEISLHLFSQNGDLALFLQCTQYLDVRVLVKYSVIRILYNNSVYLCCVYLKSILSISASFDIIRYWL